MNYKDRISELLDIYIERNKKLKDSYNENTMIVDLYEELIPLINSSYNDIIENKLRISLLLNAIYKNDIYSKFYEILIKVKINSDNSNYKEFISMIDKEYKKVSNKVAKQLKRIERSKDTVSSATRVKVAIKQNLPIIYSSYDISAVKRILDYFEIEGEISTKEVILFINEIELYNRRLLSEKGSDREKEITEAIYQQIPNMINAGGYELYPEIKISSDRKNSLDNFFNQIMNFIDSLEDVQVIPSIENYKKYDITDEEYKYIIIKILNKYENDMIDYYNFIKNKECYASRKERLEVVEEYYKCLDKFLIIREYYNNLDEEITDIEEPIVNLEETRRLVYSTTMNGLKPKIVTDMKDVPFEYYEEVFELLDRFKKGNVSRDEFKQLQNNKNLKGITELRSDQIRIVLKHLKGDIYSVNGVFVKKDNNDITMYNTMSKRPLPDISTEEKLEHELLVAKYTEETLQKMVEEKSRKGSR